MDALLLLALVQPCRGGAELGGTGHGGSGGGEDVGGEEESQAIAHPGLVRYNMGRGIGGAGGAGGR